jgi:transcriptional regulator with XRE-family HTH domain
LDTPVNELRLSLRTFCQKNHLSVRAAAKEMGVSFSALARFMRGETLHPGPHMDVAIQRFLGQETLSCPCTRCQGRVSLEVRVGRLEDWLHVDDNLRLMHESLDKLERVLGQTKTLLETLEESVKASA